MPTKAMTKATTAKKQRIRRFERPEKELFRLNDQLLVRENQSLEQPSPFVVTRTVTTYSAYEDPI